MKKFINIKGHIIQVDDIQRVSPIYENSEIYYFRVFFISNTPSRDFEFYVNKYDFNKLKVEHDKLSNFLLFQKSDSLSFFTSINLNKNGK